MPNIGTFEDGPSDTKVTAIHSALLPGGKVLYAKIVVFGGEWGSILGTVDIINLNDTTPDWSTITSMTYPRKNHNSIILPDRKILVVGGENNNGPILTPELLDTDTLTWVQNVTVTNPMEIPRRYHSSALLLPNGKVLLGGGRVVDGGDVEDDTERTMTLFSPTYLSDGVQPIITSSPTEVTYDEQFSIALSGDTYPIDSMAFIKPISSTHGYNSEQRYIELEFESDIQAGSYLVTSPLNPNIAPPGIYMFFVMKDVSESISGTSKIPSEAVFIKLS